MSSDNGGTDSEWNEGNLKSKRLDEIQSIINFYRMNPLGLSDGEFNYIHILKSIEILYGEGNAWYNPSEINEVEKLKQMAKDCLELMPPHIKNNKQGFSGIKKSFLFNKKNYEKLMDVLYDFEMEVKRLNNVHGLSSKNRDYDEGL